MHAILPNICIRKVGKMLGGLPNTKLIWHSWTRPQTLQVTTCNLLGHLWTLWPLSINRKSRADSQTNWDGSKHQNHSNNFPSRKEVFSILIGKNVLIFPCHQKLPGFPNIQRAARGLKTSAWFWCWAWPLRWTLASWREKEGQKSWSREAVDWGLKRFFRQSSV